MKNDDRKQIWVECFQTHLTLRIGSYLVVFLCVLLNLLFAWRLWRHGAADPLEQFKAMLRDYLPIILCLIVLVPVIAWDAIRFTHRLVGPIARFRRVLVSITAGEAVNPIKLRKGDYLGEFQDEFNAMLESLQKRGIAVLKPLTPSEDDRQQRGTA